MRPNREKIYLYGKHALMEALTNKPHIIRKVFLSPEAMHDGELLQLLRKANIPTAVLKHGEAKRTVGDDAAHQGVIAIADTSAILVKFDKFLEDLKPSENTLLVLLAELTDPQNVGAIIRSAVAFGASGILLPEHRQAPITASVVKASAGMVFRLPIISIGNINYTVGVLQKKFGFRAYALAMSGKKIVAEEKFDAPAIFIVGNEGQGVRQKTMEHADVTLSIPMDKRAESLNASVSAAVVLYEWSRQHGQK